MNVPLQGYEDWGLLLLRTVVGAIYIIHGLPKVKDPAQFSGFLRSLRVPLPQLFGIGVALLEFAGGMLLVLGAYTPWLGLLFAIEMAVATLLVRRKFVGGWEFDFLLLASGLLLFLSGGGAYSVDAYLKLL